MKLLNEWNSIDPADGAGATTNHERDTATNGSAMMAVFETGTAVVEEVHPCVGNVTMDMVYMQNWNYFSKGLPLICMCTQLSSMQGLPYDACPGVVAGLLIKLPMHCGYPVTHSACSCCIKHSWVLTVPGISIQSHPWRLQLTTCMRLSISMSISTTLVGKFGNTASTFRWMCAHFLCAL